MHQSTTLFLSQTIWPRWASWQFLSLTIVQTLVPVTFGYSLSSEAVVMRELRRWKRLWRRSLTHSHKTTSVGPSRRCWNDTTRALKLEEITSKGTRVLMCVLSIKVPIQKSLETYLMNLVSLLLDWYPLGIYELLYLSCYWLNSTSIVHPLFLSLNSPQSLRCN